jgi:cyclopropane fatty-acyl-phospholipid synthase-like methyltransferase
VSDATYDPESHYDRVTSAWGLLLGDELHYGLFASGDEDLTTATNALTARMLAEARIEPGLEVLDVGCGTGAPACDLVAAGATVTGITTSAVGVAEATARVTAAGHAAKATFLQRDGMDNGFPDQSFDRAWVLESSHLMRERDRLLQECHRVLRPGGRLVLCDVVLMRPMPFEDVKRLRKPLALLREVFGDAHMLELSTYVRLAEEAGLVIETADDVSAAARPTFERWRANAHAHRDFVVGELGEEDWQRFVDACDVLEQLWDEDRFGYAVLAATRPAG